MCIDCWLVVEDGEGEDVCSQSTTTKPPLNRRPHDPEGSFVVDVSITEVRQHRHTHRESSTNARLPPCIAPLAPITHHPTPHHPTPPHPQLKHDFRVRIGLSTAEEPGVEYNTGPRRARTLGRVLARGYLTGAATGGGCERGKAVTKVLLRPVTGRRHQLRVHTLYMGHPIGTCADPWNSFLDLIGETGPHPGTRFDSTRLEHKPIHRAPIPSTDRPSRTVGDTTYTGDTDSMRMMLHAASLTLPFPANKVGNQRGLDGLRTIK